MTPPPPPPSPGRRLRPVALFALGLVLIDAGIVLFRDTWERHSPDDYAEKLRACQSRPHDFVVIGGSPVSEGIDPDVIAEVRWRGEVLRDGYVLGLPGATTSETYHALIHGCPTPPKLVVYGVSPSDLNDSRQEPHGAYSLMTTGDWAEWVRTRRESREWVTRHYVQGRLAKCWAAFRYRHGIRMWAAATANETFPGCCPEAAKEAADKLAYSSAIRAGNGYAPASWFVHRRYDHAKAAGWVQPGFYYLDKYRTGAHLTYLHKIADWCGERGTTLVLLDMPVTADLEVKYPAALADYRERLREFAANREVTRLDGNRAAVGLGDEHFADLIHLNGAGAAKLSGWLRGRLADGGAGP